MRRTKRVEWLINELLAGAGSYLHYMTKATCWLSISFYLFLFITYIYILLWLQLDIDVSFVSECKVFHLTSCYGTHPSPFLSPHELCYNYIWPLSPSLFLSPPISHDNWTHNDADKTRDGTRWDGSSRARLYWNDWERSMHLLLPLLWL